MKIQQFNKCYNIALKQNIVESDYFNVSAWFWINLTTKQHIKMYNLLLKQGAKETTNVRGDKQILLSNGLGILKIEDKEDN
jgi:hypothetical protein